MLKRLEEIEKYLSEVRRSIEQDKESLASDVDEEIEYNDDADDSMLVNVDNSNGEFLNESNNNNNFTVRDSFDNNKNNNPSSNGAAHVLTENLINISKSETETNGSVSSCSSSIVASPVYYRAVRLNRPTEEELLKWDLYRHQEDLPRPWTFFKLNKSVYRPPENILDDFNNGHQLDRQRRESIKTDKNHINYDENLRRDIMNNNLKNTNNNNNNLNTTDQKSNPWKAREGNVSITVSSSCEV